MWCTCMYIFLLVNVPSFRKCGIYLLFGKCGIYLLSCKYDMYMYFLSGTVVDQVTWSVSEYVSWDWVDKLPSLPLLVGGGAPSEAKVQEAHK